jgi:uncharacterized protein YqjF (DUF2071 family)
VKVLNRIPRGFLPAPLHWMLSGKGRLRMPGIVRNPLFTADWLDVLFVHFRVDPRRLAPLVPLPLDLHDGHAYVSLVAFTQRDLRPALGGRLAALLAAPLAHHEFLNVRTYVRCGDDRGIFFLAEWIPNRLAAFVGPRTYGLPYRLGRLDYRGMRREISASGRRLTFEASPADARPDPPLDDFLLERYTAFTARDGIVRRFDVAHAPWPQRRVAVDLMDADLLRLTGDWLDDARVAAAHHSPGVRGVEIGPPRVLRAVPSARVSAG